VHDLWIFDHQQSQWLKGLGFRDLKYQTIHFGFQILKAFFFKQVTTLYTATFTITVLRLASPRFIVA
jgi:hypothetical protein